MPQSIPTRWSHGNIRVIRVRYRKVTDASDAAWNSISLSGYSLSEELPSDADVLNNEFYEVTVDARTEVGFNDSLHLQSIIMPTNATGTCVQCCIDNSLVQCSAYLW